MGLYKQIKNEIMRNRKGIIYGAILGGGYAYYVFGQKTSEIMAIVSQGGRSGLLDQAFTTLNTPEMAMLKFIFLGAMVGAFVGYMVDKMVA